jgi:hypothetical protein
MYTTFRSGKVNRRGRRITLKGVSNKRSQEYLLVWQANARLNVVGERTVPAPSGIESRPSSSDLLHSTD